MAHAQIQNAIAFQTWRCESTRQYTDPNHRENIIELWQRVGIIKPHRCDKQGCNGHVNLIKTKAKRYKDRFGGYALRCNECTRWKTPLYKTAFETSKLPIDEIMSLIFHYAELGGKVKTHVILHD